MDNLHFNVSFSHNAHVPNPTPTNPIPTSPPKAGSSPLAKYAEHWLLPGAEQRYASSRGAKRYRHYQTEQRLVSRWLAMCPPGGCVLDIPCGAGRFNELIASTGLRLIRADLSFPMVAHARQLGPNRNVLGDLCCDLASPPLAPGSVNVVLVWRLFHHCRTPQDRDIVLQQAARLARDLVIISYYNRANITYWTGRLLRTALSLPPKGRGAIWTSELIEAANRAGLEPVEIHHYIPGLSINSAACFRLRT